MRFSAPKGANCPNEQGFRDIVAGRLGYDPFQEQAALSIEASIARKDVAFTGKVRVMNAQGAVVGARDLDAPEQDCGELGSAMAIAISILLDPLGVGAHQESEAPAPSTEAPAHAPPASPEPSRRTEQTTPPEPTRQNEHLRVGLALEGMLAGGLGLAPGPTLGPMFGVGARIGQLSLLAEGRVDFMPGDATTDTGDRVEATIFSIGPTGCWGFGIGLVCLSLQAGTFQGRGLDVVDSSTQSSFFASADIHGGVELPLGSKLSFRVLPELRVPLVRTSLAVDDVTVWNAGPIAGGLLFGFGAAFL